MDKAGTYWSVTCNVKYDSSNNNKSAKIYSVDNFIGDSIDTKTVTTGGWTNINYDSKLVIGDDRLDFEECDPVEDPECFKTEPSS